VNIVGPPVCLTWDHLAVDCDELSDLLCKLLGSEDGQFLFERDRVVLLELDRLKLDVAVWSYVSNSDKIWSPASGLLLRYLL